MIDILVVIIFVFYFVFLLYFMVLNSYYESNCLWFYFYMGVWWVINMGMVEFCGMEIYKSCEIDFIIF